MARVSVVITTYRSGPELDRVIASLDAQTMPADEFEVLLLDDGSGDGTVDRLRRFAAERPTYQVHELSHSGWPSRPRNVGIQRAVGDYVVFVDHDDVLYPPALAEAYAFAAEHRLDVLNTKDISYSAGNWSWLEYTSDDAVPGPADPELLVPMMPHKLYRRSFLLEQGIEFVEGRQVHWEDRIFNVDVLAKAQRVGRLSSVPFYQKHTTGQNISKSFVGDPRGRDLDQYWRVLEQLHDHFAATLTAEQLLVIRRMDYLAYVLRNWVGPRTLSRGRELCELSRERMQPFLAKHAPPELDVGLARVIAARSHLLRTGQNERIWELAETDAKVWAKTTPATLGRTEDDRLTLSCATTWRVSGDGELGLRRSRGRLWRRLSPELQAALPADLLDVTDEIGSASSVFAVREAGELAPYPLAGTTSDVQLGGDDEKVSVTTSATVVLDTGEGILGRPLPPGKWNFALRSDFMGYFHRKPLRAARGQQPVFTLSHGYLDRVAEREGLLVLTRAKQLPGLLTAAGLKELRPDQVHTERAGVRSTRWRIALPALACVGRTSLPCIVVLTDAAGRKQKVKARLRGGPGGAVLTGATRLASGRYDLSLRFAGETVQTQVQIVVNRLRRSRAESRR